jgi:outer membrane immunogenic protein
MKNLEFRRAPSACKIISIGIAAAAIATSPARAADIPLSNPVRISVAAPFSWTGFYAGINGGPGGGSANPTYGLSAPDLFFGSASTDHETHRLGGAFVGGQIGYNYQFPNRVVLGVESDLQWSNISALNRTDTSSLINILTTPSSGLTTTSMAIRQNWFGTTRLRLGYQFVDRFLAYVTGGVAYSEINASNAGVGAELSGPSPEVFSGTSGSATSTRIGWTAGAGVEYALSNNLSVKSEYLYTEYSGITAPYLNVADLTPPVTSGTFSTGTLGIHLVRAGLNYKFGETGEAPGSSRLPVKAISPPAFAWTGFYVGVNAGYGAGGIKPAQAETTQSLITFGRPISNLSVADLNDTLRLGGALVGGQFGYNRQLANNFAIGVETDFQWSDIRASKQSNTAGAYNDPSLGPFSSSYRMNIAQNWFGTTRLRLGYQVFDRFLAYVTGGVAYSEITASNSAAATDSTFGTFVSSTNGSGSATKVGWTLGAGVEYPVVGNLSLKTEYLYTEYSGIKVPYRTVDGSPFFSDTTQGSLSTGTLGIHLLRAGLNWKLD